MAILHSSRDLPYEVCSTFLVRNTKVNVIIIKRMFYQNDCREYGVRQLDT